MALENLDMGNGHSVPKYTAHLRIMHSNHLHETWGTQQCKVTFHIVIWCWIFFLAADHKKYLILFTSICSRWTETLAKFRRQTYRFVRQYLWENEQLFLEFKIFHLMTIKISFLRTRTDAFLHGIFPFTLAEKLFRVYIRLEISLIFSGRCLPRAYCDIWLSIEAAFSIHGLRTTTVALECWKIINNWLRLLAYGNVMLPQPITIYTYYLYIIGTNVDFIGTNVCDKW